MTPLEIRVKSLELAARIGSPFAYVSTFIETNTTDNNRVIAIYPPRRDAGWFEQLIEPKKDVKPFWTIARNMITLDEVKQKLGLAEDEDLYIIKL